MWILSIAVAVFVVHIVLPQSTPQINRPAHLRRLEKRNENRGLYRVATGRLRAKQRSPEPQRGNKRHPFSRVFRKVSKMNGR